MSKSDKSKIIMIACVNPSYSSANHTINTLRYSDRLKEKTSQMNKYNNNNLNNNNNNLNKNIKTNLNNNYNYNNNAKMKEIDDINSHIFNLKDDNIHDIDFDDRMNVEDKFPTGKQ